MRYRVYSTKHIYEDYKTPRQVRRALEEQDAFLITYIFEDKNEEEEKIP